MLKSKSLIAILWLGLSVLIFCGNKKETKDYTQFVNPFIGTVGNANTFPGPTMPHGMVQLSPFIKMNKIFGFSHTHNSGGAGGGSGVKGDILFMPNVGNYLTGKDMKFVSSYSHSNEKAKPGYYKVLLDDSEILVELTTTTRVGFHKYTFPKSGKASVLLDIGKGEIKVENNKIAGHTSNNWFFIAEFSQPIRDYILSEEDKDQNNSVSVNGDNVKGVFIFDVKVDKPLLLKVALSPVSVEGANKNLSAELQNWNFDQTRNKAQAEWNKELGKIEVEGGTKDDQIIFYTSLYHAMIHPNMYMDVDKQYRSTNGKIYTAEDFDNYTTFSLWDTFRATHPLYTIIDRTRTNEYIATFLERYEHTGRMLIMEFFGVEGEVPPMIGYHSLSVIADAYVKDIKSYDVEKAYKAMVNLANDTDREGKQLYLDYGFIPADLKGQSVSRTLEYSYDDWCVTRLAKDFNDADNLYFSQRGEFYKNVFDTNVNFMRGRMSNFQWVPDFDPMETINHYTEANAYQYTTFVPQDIDGLMELMGGDKALENWLDECFNTELDPSKVNVRDVSGLIGQYAHGNEPSHHIAYLYNFTGTPWKTQAMVRKIMSTQYHNSDDGIEGNEDCGQLSAWYVLSSMGIYSVTPGMDYYVIGSPIFDRVTIHMENGNDFEIIAKNNGKDSPYIQSATLNGKTYSKSYINYFEFMNGSKLVLEMGETPNHQWGTKKDDRPYSAKNQFIYASTPEVSFSEISFLESRTIKLSSNDVNAKIYYSLDGSPATENSILYKNPIVITDAVTLSARSYVDGIYPSYPVTVHFKKLVMFDSVNVSNLEPGIKYYYKEGGIQDAKHVKDYPTLKSGIMETFNVNAVKDQRPFGYNFEGYIKVQETGIYEFSLEANDGAVLYINDQLIIDNDGGHRAQKLFSKVGLKKGWHPIKLDYFQQGLAKSLTLTWEGPGVENQEVSKDVLYHQIEKQ